MSPKKTSKKRKSLASTKDMQKLDPAMLGLYDGMMAEIEPDLVSANIDGLEKKYTGETAEQHHERGERYEKAFAAWNERFTMLISIIKNDMEAAKEDEIEFQKMVSSGEDQEGLSALETSIDRQ